MVYIVLALGFIVGIYALSRFFLKANPQQIKNVMFILAIIAFTFVLLFFAFTGRIIVAIALLIPVVFIVAQAIMKKKKDLPPPSDDEK